MRRCLTTFIVILLALRGLLGDAVAMQLVQPPAPAAAHTSQHTHSAPAKANGVAEHCASATSAHCSHSADDSACSSCVVCHIAWGMFQHMAVPSATGSTPTPPHWASTLASAPARSPIKPPIV